MPPVRWRRRHRGGSGGRSSGHEGKAERVALVGGGPQRVVGAAGDVNDHAREAQRLVLRAVSAGLVAQQQLVAREHGGAEGRCEWPSGGHGQRSVDAGLWV